MCPSGFKLGEDWKTCQDVDECATSQSVRDECYPKRCKNTEGSYECVEDELESVESRELCDSGFEFDSERNVCREVCREGEVWDIEGNECQDVDECLEERICGSGICVNQVSFLIYKLRYELSKLYLLEPRL